MFLHPRVHPSRISLSAKDLPTCGPACPGPGKAPRKCQAPKRREPPPTLPYCSAWVPLAASNTTMILAKARDMPRCARVRKPSPPLPGVSQTGPEKEEMNSTAVCRTRPARVSPEEPKGKGLGPWQQKLSQEMSWL
ncbi:hypothetical protein CSIM01_01754 [Colletotrichum simmondsii]|uniref:Uncharacterized protein n=1 Tax=Colletotrichum simmondsii TaxID=703756 RepID=A0A135T4D0_9PEZI|nr:hypothetical protein CSIM01_01754 [Colletotrichum simmondsii]